MNKEKKIRRANRRRSLNPIVQVEETTPKHPTVTEDLCQTLDTLGAIEKDVLAIDRRIDGGPPIESPATPSYNDTGANGLCDLATRLLSFAASIRKQTEQIAGRL